MRKNNNNYDKKNQNSQLFEYEKNMENIGVKKVLELLILISNGEASLDNICETLNVSKRTAYRYIKAIKNAGFPLKRRDKREEVFRFEEDKLPWTVAFNPEELVILYSTFDFLSKTSEDFIEYIEKWKRAINVVIKDKTKEKIKRVQNPIIFLTQEPIYHETDFLKKIINAIVNQKQLCILYKKQGGDNYRERIIEPIKLLYREGFWYIFAYCLQVEDLRMFAVDRIKEIRERNTPCFRVNKYKDTIEEKIKNMICVIKDRTIKVKLQFLPEVASCIKRKSKWHPREEREELEDGSIILKIETYGEDEIRPWILKWIPHVKVLEPESLRKKLKKDFLKAVKECF